MRKQFAQQLSVNIVPIQEVKITEKSRDDIPKILIALQTIFLNPEYNKKVFDILEKKSLVKSKKQVVLVWIYGKYFA